MTRGDFSPEFFDCAAEPRDGCDNFLRDDQSSKTAKKFFSPAG